MSKKSGKEERWERKIPSATITYRYTVQAYPGVPMMSSIAWLTLLVAQIKCATCRKLPLRTAAKRIWFIHLLSSQKRFRVSFGVRSGLDSGRIIGTFI